MFKFPIYALLLSAVVSAQAPHKNSLSTFESSIDGVIAQVVAGGAWRTTITLVNLDSTITNYTIKFFGDNGVALPVQTTDGTGSVLSGSIPVGGSHVLSTIDSQADKVGWARVITSNVAGGNAVFRQRVAGRPDFEASMPIVVYLDSNVYVVPIDNFNAANGIGLVNPSTFSDITIFFSFFNEQGVRVFLDSVSLGPNQHTSFDLGTRFPPSFGLRGTVKIETTGSAMSVLALRFIGEAFTSLLPMAR